MYISLFFFFNDAATTEIYTLSLHDALPILRRSILWVRAGLYGDEAVSGRTPSVSCVARRLQIGRSEEHTSELQSHVNLVCRLLLEKKKMAVLAGVADAANNLLSGAPAPASVSRVHA